MYNSSRDVLVKTFYLHVKIFLQDLLSLNFLQVQDMVLVLKMIGHVFFDYSLLV